MRFGRRFVAIFFLIVIGLASTSVFAGEYEDGLTAFDKGDYTRALALLEPFAVKGDAAAQYALAVMYRFGKGTKVNSAEAVKWYQASAKQNFRDAQNNLGVMYELGKGVKRNYATAAEWYRKAANQGDELAMGNLGVLYLTGRGIARDPAEAQKLFAAGAKLGDARSKKYLKLTSKR
jgi:uncharacterized protein